MAKSASQRRFTRLVDELGDLRSSNPQRFQIVWQAYFRGWVQEVQRRAAAQRQDAADAPIPATFGILERARNLARGIGADPELSFAELAQRCRSVTRFDMPHRLMAG